MLCAREDGCSLFEVLDDRVQDNQVHSRNLLQGSLKVLDMLLL